MIKPWILVVFGTSLLYQILHWIEHVAQVYQHWWLGLPIAGSHGIIFFLDLEWNHFVFNTLYLAGLLVVGVGMYRTDPAWFRARSAAAVLLLGGILVQVYHQLEHTVKIYQHLLNNCEPCPGILGKPLDGVYLHFAFNTVVLVLPLLAFFLGGFFSDSKKYLSRYLNA